VSGGRGAPFARKRFGQHFLADEGVIGDIVRAIQNLRPGEYSEPELTVFPDGSRAFRIVYLRAEVKPHLANLIQDYARIQQAALDRKKAGALDKWVEKTRASTFVSINSGFTDCPASAEWVNRSSVYK
jgi:peptidyl-prolyl cis-trans isomerase SurA